MKRFKQLLLIFPLLNSTASKMACAPLHAAQADVGCCDSGDPASRTVSVSLDRLQRLEACEARSDLQERHIELLQKQIAETDAALKLELARGDNHAEALMHIARTCDARTSEIREQHASALRDKDAASAKIEDGTTALTTKLLELTALHAAAISKTESQKEVITKLEAQHKDAIVKLEAENAALKAQIASTLKDLVTAVTTGAMEIFPVRPSDSRQFSEWRSGGIPPPPPQFDRAWCAAVSADEWEAAIDGASGDMRATVAHIGSGFCTLRSATPLPRGPSPRPGPGGRQQLPAFRVIVAAYGLKEESAVGLVPSHHAQPSSAAAAVAPTPNYGIHNYGGWYIGVHASHAGGVVGDTKYSGWTVMTPADSAYATTTQVPPVPAGGAVEFAVDYAAGTCRVAFYTPAAVLGGFVEAPHAKMELRFVATAANQDGAGRPIPARTVPTTAESGVALYPAVETYEDSRNVWCFAAV
jgi:hypothetical protein